MLEEMRLAVPGPIPRLRAMSSELAAYHAST